MDSHPYTLTQTIIQLVEKYRDQVIEGSPLQVEMDEILERLDPRGWFERGVEDSAENPRAIEIPVETGSTSVLFEEEDQGSPLIPPGSSPSEVIPQ